MTYIHIITLLLRQYKCFVFPYYQFFYVNFKQV